MIQLMNKDALLRSLSVLITMVAFFLFIIACGSETPTVPSNTNDSSNSKDTLSGTVEIDGSSTVFPISEAVAEDFRLYEQSKVRVNVAISGTGGGFKRFITGETDISNASRVIKDKEINTARENDIEFIEMRVGTDGLSVVVNPKNDFVECLTVEELNKIWASGSDLDNWNQVRPEFPDRPLRLYGPDTDSGTFDYFTEEINGEAQVSRSDYTASADDNVLVQGISGDRNALGYFGYAYYIENSDKLKAVAVDDGNGCVNPGPVAIADGSYTPLSRPLFIYVNVASLADPAVKAFVQYYMEEGAKLTSEVGYIAADDSVYANNLAAIK